MASNPKRKMLLKVERLKKCEENCVSMFWNFLKKGKFILMTLEKSY